MELSLLPLDIFTLVLVHVPVAITNVGDFNNDNISDIVVVNYGTNSIVVLSGFGDGSFLLGSAYSTGAASSPMALAKGDFNKDGRLGCCCCKLEVKHSRNISWR